MKSKSVVVLSGGLDSAVLCYKLQADGIPFRGIHFDIGYLPRIPERNASKMLSQELNFPLELVDVSGIFDMVTGFVPTELLGRGELDKGQPGPKGGDVALDDADSDYVSGFHSIVSLASYYAMLARVDEVVVGIIKEQIDHNDGVATFLKTFPAVVGHLNAKRPFQLSAPFASMKKAEVIKLGIKLGVHLERTWSCYGSGPLQCGTCTGCRARKIGFTEAAVADPTTYAVSTP